MLCSISISSSSLHFTLPSSLFLQPHNTAQLTTPTFFRTLRQTNPTLTCSSQLNLNPNPNPKQPRKRPPAAMDGQKPTSRNRRRSSYGTSRRSILKKTFTQEQVNFTGPVPEDPVVGIIGGGMAGLLCALHLEKRGVRSTVFDTGIHGLGGRMGTRIIDPQPLIFDHAAQFFTVSDPRFAELVRGWCEKDLVRQWLGTVGELKAGGHFVPIPSSSTPRYVAVNGMRLLADSILSQTCMVDVVRPCWISKLEPYNGMWYLSENGKPRGQFDAIVVAHNGKCANRLLALSGLPLIARQMKRLELSSIWALLAAFEDPLPVPRSDGLPLEGAFVKGIDSVSWMANNSKKLLGSSSVGPNSWTFFSTADFGKRNKVPQENIPTATAEKMKARMLEGVEVALGLSKDSLPRPFYTRLQLWGAALPTNTPGIPYIFDPQGRAGMCGDWLLGSSLESAALSGMALANHIADYFQNSGFNAEEFAVGLHAEFRSLKGHDIGQFPGMDSEKKGNEAMEFQLTT